MLSGVKKCVGVNRFGRDGEKDAVRKSVGQDGAHLSLLANT